MLLDGVNTDETLKAGMKANATITVDTVPNVLTAPIQAVKRDRSVSYVWKRTADGPVPVLVKVGANNESKVVIEEGLSEGDQIYRTAPGGQAEPKFDQPELPEPDPNAVAQQQEEATASASESSSSSGNRRGQSRASRKKYAEMTAEELGEAKGRLARMAGSMSNWLQGEQLTAATDKINAIVNAIDQGELDKAQTLNDAMMKEMRPGRGRRGGE